MWKLPVVLFVCFAFVIAPALAQPAPPKGNPAPQFQFLGTPTTPNPWSLFLAYPGNVPTLMMQDNNGGSTPIGTFTSSDHYFNSYNTISSNTVPYIGHVQVNGLDIISKIAAAARINNPRVNPVMTSPPAISSSSSHNSALSLQVTPVTTASGTTPGGSSINTYGGVLTSDGVGCYKFPVNTVNGVFSEAVWRVETLADSAKLEFKIVDISGSGIVNFIVNGQYVSYTVTTPSISGYAYVTLDFTSAGGRQPRDIIMEAYNSDFCQVAIAPTETISRPQGTVLTAVVQGDSMSSGGGATPIFATWTYQFCDMMGIRDCRNASVGGRGIVTSAFGANCAQTVSDLVAATPAIIVLACGRDDVGSVTPTAEQAAALAWFQSVRAQSTLAKVPIVVLQTYGVLGLSSTQPIEAAIDAAAAAMNDPLIFVLKDVNSPDGPIITGTGYIGNTTGAGNSDIYTNADGIHYNAAGYGNSPESGHFFVATKFADKFMQSVTVP